MSLLLSFFQSTATPGILSSGPALLLRDALPSWSVVGAQVRAGLLFVRRVALAVGGQVERGVLGEGAARFDVRQRQQAGEVARVQRAPRRGAWFAVDGAIAGQDAQVEEVVAGRVRSEEHTSELQSLMRISYAVFCLKKK